MNITHAASSPAEAPRRRGLWQQAKAMAEQTPAERNRYVDFLRALSIFAVIFGHWLVAATQVQDGVLVGENMLGVQPWTQWLTWKPQVSHLTHDWCSSMLLITMVPSI